MDFSLKQWKDQQQHESEDEPQQNNGKIPRKMLFDSPQNQQEPVAAAIPLFLSPHHSSSPSSLSRFPIGGRKCFSMAQWQELELQALIYRHMVAGSTIPPELLQLVKKSLLTSPYYLHHYPPAALLQAGYWGKGALDPEPGRCRRTDGKKWRCSRDIVAGHKYCERHVHRGRNRSRKPVEFPTSSPSTATAAGDAVLATLRKPSATFIGGSAGGSAQFSLSSSRASSFDTFQLHSGSGELRSDKKTRFDTQQDSTSGDGKSNNTVLMDFFDDWPRSLHESTRGQANGNTSSTNLSMSTPGNSTSDFLRLSTGNGDETGQNDGHGPHGNWTRGWGGNPVVSMGGPLAEALRSSSNSSPTSVLHQLPRCSAADTSFASA